MPRFIKNGTFKDGNGKAVLSGTVTVLLAGTSTGATIYAAASGGSAITGGIITSSSTDGSFSFYVDDDDYGIHQLFDIKVSKTNLITKTYQNVRVEGLSKATTIKYANEYTTFAAAITAIGSTVSTLVVSEVETVAATLTVPSTLTLRFIGAGQLSVSATYTVTVSGEVEAPRRQIFSGAGTVNGLIEVWVEWFGAVGDNTTDSATAFQAAIDSLNQTAVVSSASAGGTVFVGSGSYVVGTALTRTDADGFKMIGLTNRSSWIRWTGTGNVLTLGTTGTASHFFELKNIQFIANRDGTTDGVKIIRCHYYTIEGCKFTQMTGDGLEVMASFGGTIWRNRFISNTLSGLRLVHTGSERNNSITISQNIMDGNTGWGIDMADDATNASFDIVVNRNIITGNGDGGIRTTHYIMPEISRNEIEANDKVAAAEAGRGILLGNGASNLTEEAVVVGNMITSHNSANAGSSGGSAIEVKRTLNCVIERNYLISNTNGHIIIDALATDTYLGPNANYTETYLADSGTRTIRRDLQNIRESPVRSGVTTGITAGTTQTQAGATALTTELNVVGTVANTSDAIKLPTAISGIKIKIVNNGANALAVWPNTSDNLGAGVDTVDASTLAAGANRTYMAYDSTNWETF